MTNTIAHTVSMLEMLPAQEQDFAYEFVKRLVLAWDPDYTNQGTICRRSSSHYETKTFQPDRWSGRNGSNL